MDSQGAGYAFDVNMDFSNAFATLPQQQQSFLKPVEGDTSGFFADEAIDTSASFIDPAMFSTTPQQASFDMQHSLTMDNTSGSTTAWHTQLTPDMHHALNTFPLTPVPSLDSMYQSNFSTSLGKRPLQVDAQDFPQAKRHETADFTLFSPLVSTATTSSWGIETQSTSNSMETGLSDEAADVCATWFNKYNILPSDRHIESLSQLTGESADVIRSWFGRLLKQGMGGSHGDSAYKSQTNLIPQEQFWNDQFSTGVTQTSPPQLLLQQQQEDTTTSEAPCSHDTTTVNQSATTLRGSKKRCAPTEDLQLLSRDPNKIYQCTRKCGKRYGRKCDWKRNEEEGYPCKSWVCSLCTSEGVENVKPCFRKYHYAQHFRNIHPDINADEYEEASVVCSETEFPRQCGFCRHRFVSRQERIDHIADHFKQGKCMLDWNDEDVDDSHDSDNTDDDDDRPSGDGFDGSKPSSDPRDSDPRGGSSSNYYGGNDGGSGSDSQPPHGGFFQFQLSQLSEGSGSQPSCANQCIKPTNLLQHNQQCATARPDTGEQGSICGSIASEQPLAESISAAGDDKGLVARDVLPRTTLVDQTSRSAVDAVWPEAQLDPSQSNNTVCEAARTRLQTSNDRRPRSPERLRPITVTPGLDAPSPGFQTRQSSGVFLGTKATSVRKDTATEQGLISQQALHSIPTNSQSFLSIRLLGAGGFSTVDEVVHRETNLRMGRKTLKNRDQTALEEIRKEVDVLQKLRHPHVIRYLGAYSTGDKMSILVSPVAETTLGLWMEQVALDNPAYLAETIVKMFGCLASSVRYLHEQRPVVNHMDIKPQNILIVGGDQELPHVVLCDFGTSSSEDSLDGQSKPLTRQYTAPEVFEGFTRKQAADIWSLGCVFAEMASVSFSQGNSAWPRFRKEFSGRTGKYYWQDIPFLQSRLSQFLEEAPTVTEQTVVRTLKTMLSAEPTQRPDARSLTMIFTPAPCCLHWPNDKATFPGPHAELGEVEMLGQKDGIDCCTQLHLRGETSKETDTNLPTAKGWLEECSHSHDACRQQTLGDAKFLPTRLVDVRPGGQEGSFVRVVNSTCIESTADQVEYVALSHLWNQEHVTLSSDSLQDMLTNLPLQTLPTAVQAAVSTAQRLGYRYIWVDSLCILQDSEDDKRHECATMASVFRNAALTVVLDQMTTSVQEDKSVVLLTNDNLDHTLPLPSQTRSSITEDHLPVFAALPAVDFTSPNFGWDTRAWALQERLLSRRFLHLGEQMYWECNSLKASETFPRGLSPLVWEKVHSKTPQGLQSGSSGRTTDTVLSIPASLDSLENKPVSVSAQASSVLGRREGRQEIDRSGQLDQNGSLVEGNATVVDKR
ncbi:uncharacterized protein K460DRAFT_272554 [Cucurbitaria berberidis CBS 394.84]|uniref:Protein kinase domain-containing protein n=1 Tax=Cucurbitaria berberidis CBS 394.84 TaxID=1168544 RepID=A0A9P4GU73_9PLEO|nr:uncharacterized protein K460DRAFT_272554 [Cucurbitaria berberidis CBS 394.84]KAF1851596.1 hypothetical protein K460DRAFT_272554 [Cucurbitaria berberidis CBS 394.84]